MTKAKIGRTKLRLHSGTTARALPEWQGKTPSTRPPLQVQLRILARQGGKCAITGHRFAPGDQKRLDHTIPAADGGPNSEGNLRWVLDIDHRAKTKAEAGERAKVRAKAIAHAGIRATPSRPLESRNDLPQGAQAAKRTKDRLPVPSTPSELERRYGIVDRSRKR